MILLFIFLIIIVVSLIVVVVFLFFNKEKSEHELVMQNIQQTIEEQEQTFEKQRSCLFLLQNVAECTENSMVKVVHAFSDISISDDPYLEQHLENLDSFSKTSLELIKIYGRFVKVLS